MKKMVHRLMICGFVCVFFWVGALLADHAFLSRELIRFHVVANSDSQKDQEIKLQVRDAILNSLEKDLQNIQDVELAKQYIQENIPKLQTIANQVLERYGLDLEAAVTLCREVFPTREYDTFRLPAGIYETLRITIGEGNGKNWWCVAFPSLCLPDSSAGFEAAAAAAGFSEELTESLSKENNYQIRFFLMDAAGKLAGYLFEK